MCFEIVDYSVPVIHNELSWGESNKGFFLTENGKKYLIENTCLDEDYDEQTKIFNTLINQINKNNIR